MNGLLDWALREIGFKVKRVNGGVARALRGDTAIGNHLVLLIDLGETFLADVGFGDGFFEPVPLVAAQFTQRGFNFKLEQLPDGYWRLHNHQFGAAPSFDFREDPADEALFAEKCQYLQTSPDSPFVMALVAQRFTATGYEIQRGKVARQVTPNEVTTTIMDNEQQLIERLRSTFGIDTPEVADIWPAICASHNKLFTDSATLLR